MERTYNPFRRKPLPAAYGHLARRSARRVVLIQGAAFTGANAETLTTFGCTEAAEAGRFTVPRDILASMVASNVMAPLNIPTGSVVVAHFTHPARFTATGLDHGSIIWESFSATQLHFQ